MIVQTYIQKPNGQKYKSRLDGDVVPAGSICVITNGVETVTFPFESSAANYNLMQIEVNKMMAKGKK